MKRLFMIPILGFMAILTLSCDESLNPYSDLQNKYVLNCVIRGDTTFQVAYLTKSYQTNDYNPYSNTEDEAIHGATIRLWSGKDKVAILKDTTLSRSESDSYKTKYSLYYSNNFQPYAGDSITIEALLPNGRRLKSKTTAPGSVYISSESDKYIPTESHSYVSFMWDTSQDNMVFITRLGIYYYKYLGNIKTTCFAVIPIKYIQYGGEWIPSYPRPTSEKVLSVDMAVISKTMQLISEGDSNKSNYVILGCVLEVLSLDKNLSMYYNSTARGQDIYSVRLDETDISTINGGLGIFGIYMKTKKVSFLTHSYIKSFGYTPGLEGGKDL
jgi:hypothetical protein